MGRAEHGRKADLRVPVGSPFSVGPARWRPLQLLERFADIPQKLLTGFGQLYPSRAALEQPHPQIAFQHRDVAAHRCRREGQSPGRRREAAGLCAAHEALEIGQGLHVSPYIIR
jgi:hypothetical protein